MPASRSQALPASAIVRDSIKSMRGLRTINGRQIYLESHGPKSGYPIVFLHHGLGAVRSWKEQVPFFAEAGYRVVVYDRPGHGKSGSRSGWGMPYFETDREDLERLLDELQIERAALVGHSDGGKIAMYFAADNPGRVSRLAVVAAHIYVETKMVPGIRQVLEDYNNDTRFREKLHRVHGDKAEALFYGWYEGWTDPAWDNWDMRPVLRKITCPALVVQGLDDEHATPQHALDIAGNIPGAELWIAPGVGHMLPQDMPEEFNRRLLEFLKRIGWEQ